MRDARVRKHAEAALRASEEQLRLLQNEFAHMAGHDLGEMAAAISHESTSPLPPSSTIDTALFVTVDGYSEDRLRRG